MLGRTPTPVKPFRVGILAPAIPGRRTFVDFNAREPGPFESAQNQINKVVIVYNYKDYAVSKENKLLLDINLSRFYGSTSLGCNDSDKGELETALVKDALGALGYQEPDKLIFPLEFQTPFRTDLATGKLLPTREHCWRFYIADPVMKDFLDELFN